MNKKKLIKARQKIDQIDRPLFKAIKSRTAIVKYMLSLKEKRNQIIDQKRINQILKNIRKKSIKNKIDPKITNHIWKNMIKSYIDYERRNFKSK